MFNTENKNIISIIEPKKRTAWNKGIPNSGFKKGYTPYNKGIPNTEIQKKKNSDWHIGKMKTEATREKMSEAKRGWKMPEAGKIKLSAINMNKKLSDTTKKKMSETRIRIGTKPPLMFGSDNPNWVEDRTQVDMNKRRNHSKECIEWREKIFKMSGYKCNTPDKNCKGQLEAHHILRWVDHPELRFNINNGISLCHAHHPRKRGEEKRLESYFMELVSVLQHILS